MPQAPARPRELRWVSVLFVDLVGSTEWASQSHPEAVRDLLSGYFDVARTVVGRYGGRVEKFVGDAVVAVWGSTVANDDDAERAVRAALEVVGAVPAYGEERGAPGLQARAGVVTGQVVTWSGDGEGIVAGERVNVAARVQAAAEPGSVLVDDATRRATQAAVGYDDAGEHDLRGTTGGTHLWRAARVVAGVRGGSRVDGLETAFLGRSHDLAVVKELFHATVESGRARLVDVVGPAGVGKSRLAWEFQKYVDGLVSTTLWHEGRCLSYGDGVALWSLAQLVRQRLDVPVDDPDLDVEQVLAERLPRWLPDPADRAFVAPRLAVLLGAGPADLSPAELFAGWRVFLERLAEVAPVVWVVEDAQWADPRLLDFVDHLLEYAAGSPILVIGLARPELGERRRDWPPARANVSTVRLDVLGDDAVGALLDGLVPGLPAAARERIVAQSAGLPLYAVETVRSLVDRHIVVERDGVHRLVGEVGELEVPAGLTSLITGRIDRLPPAERDLLKGLAVLGDTFPASAVPAVCDEPPERLDELLRSLVRKELLSRKAEHLAAPREQLAFMQTMLRTVALGLLTRRERRALHLAVADHLRRVLPHRGEEMAEVIAAHHRDAYLAAVADPDAQELRVQAVHAFERAGNRAAEVGAPTSALRSLLAGAELAEDDDVRLRLTAAAGDAAMTAGRTEEALALYEQVVDAHEKAGRTREAAIASMRQLCRALAASGSWREVVERCDHADGLLREEPDDEAEAWVAYSRARALTWLGHPAESLPHYERVLTLCAELGHTALLADALAGKGRSLSFVDRTVEATVALAGAARLLGELGLVEPEAVARINLADILLQGDLPGAVEEHHAAAALYRRIGGEMECVVRANLSMLTTFTGQWDEARDEAELACSLARSPLMRAAGTFALTWLMIARGEVADARGRLEDLRRLCDVDDAQYAVLPTVAEAGLLLVEGDPEAALPLARAAVESAVSLRTDQFRLSWPVALDAALACGRVDEAARLLDLVAAAPPGHVPPYLRVQQGRYAALVRAASGDDTGVDEDLQAARDGFASLGYPYWQARATADLARRRSQQDRHDDARALLADASAALRALPAPLVADRLLARPT